MVDPGERLYSRIAEEVRIKVPYQKERPLGGRRNARTKKRRLKR